MAITEEVYRVCVLEKFNLKNAKFVGIPLGSHFKLSRKTYLLIKEEKGSTIVIPYSSMDGNFMYDRVCTRSDIGHAVEVVNKFLVNSSKDHKKTVQWIFRYLKGSSKVCLSFKVQNQFWRVMQIQI